MQDRPTRARTHLRLVTTDRDRWTSRITAWRAGAAKAGRVLLDDCVDATGQISRRYPAVYFELCRKDGDSTASLGHQVFWRLDCRQFGRFPFSGRTPFDAYVAEDMADESVRYHSFSARLSITREALREQYNFNVRHHPEWAEREQIHREVVTTLRESGNTWPGRSPRYPRYGLASWSQGPRSPRPDWDRDDLVRIVTRRANWPLSSRIEMVLAKRGAPMYPAEISSILQEAAVRSSDSSVDPDQLPDNSPSRTELEAQLTVRRVLAERWGKLQEVERQLLALLVAGRPYREVVERLPGFNDPSAVTRALARICTGFLADLGEALGATAASDLRPQQQAELLFGVLAQLPDVRVAMEAVR